jgi:hypothetical protein
MSALVVLDGAASSTGCVGIVAIDPQPLGRRLVAEGTGSFFLFATVIGSGIMA